MGLEIGFAYTSFKWANNAKNNAGVTCIILGIRKISNNPKFIFENNLKKHAQNINGYLLDFKDIYIEKRRTPLSILPPMIFGSMPNDGGHLLLTAEEKNILSKQHPSSFKFIRKIIGAEEFINGIEKYCLWINKETLNEAIAISPIKKRMENVRIAREKSPREITKKLAAESHRFGEIRHQEKNYTFVPSITSENRDYIPIGYFTAKIIPNNRAHVIYHNDLVIFGILSSNMHNVWVKAVAGRLETRITYSAEICYNNFPITNLNNQQKETVRKHVLKIIAEREKHPEKTISELYDPRKMPAGLKEAHRNLDAAIDSSYRSKPFESDKERLEYLFKLHEEMSQNEQKKENND